jgi:tRNA(Ile)-lysidine synthase
VLQYILGPDARVETATIEAITAAFGPEAPVSGYTNNIQGNLAISANKQGLRIEPMETYRLRRKRV